MRVSLMLVIVLSVTFASFAGEPPTTVAGAQCTLSGTWYGGSDPAFPFIWTFTPAGPNRFTSVTNMGTDCRFLGYTYWTPWQGDVVRTGPNSFESAGLSFWIWDPLAAAAAAVDGSLPELDIVRSRIEMIDCNTFTSTVEVYAGYLAWTTARTPFEDPYDVSYLPPEGNIVETYHRISEPLANVRDVPYRKPDAAEHVVSRKR